MSLQHKLNKTLLTLGIFAGLLLGTSALADGVTSANKAPDNDKKITSLLFTCNLSFTAHGKSIYFGLGYTHFSGKGILSCYDLITGASQHINLRVSAVGPGVGFGVTNLDISGSAVGLKIARDPESLLGRYVSVGVNAAVGVGVGVAVPIRISKNDVSINVEAEGLAGLGAGVDFLAVDIEADGHKVVDTPVTVAIAPPTTPTENAVPSAVGLDNRPAPLPAKMN